MRGILCLFLLLTFVCYANGSQKCVSAKGKVRCDKNPFKVLSMELRMFDRDGKWIFSWFDKDDLMGVTVPDQYGNFTLEGCGNDYDWLPFTENDPEPYITIFHYCNSEDGEEIRYPEFSVFLPETYRPPDFILD